MKLLSKQQVRNQVEENRRVQINEGIILAKKIDGLRQTLNALELQHSNFLKGMEKELNAKTSKLLANIQQLESEIVRLEVQRKELLKPLDLEWKKLEYIQAENDKARENLTALFKEYTVKEERINDRDKESKEKLSHIKVRERELERTFDKADQLRMDTEKGYIKMSEEKEKQEKIFDKRNAEANIRENSITSYEFTLKQREEQIELKEKQLEKQRLQLIDQRQTLERAMARLRK